MNRRLVTGTGLIVALALFLTVNIIANQTLTSLRLDLTENRLYTLSAGSRNILGQLAEPVTLRLYFSAKAFADVPQLLNYGKRVRDMLEEYVATADGKLRLQVIEETGVDPERVVSIPTGIDLDRFRPGDTADAKWYLTKKGKRRGYGDSMELTGEGGGPAQTEIVIRYANADDNPNAA